MQPSTPYTHAEIFKWTLAADAVAPCFVEDVFKLLQCSEDGLSNDEAKRRIEIFGPNRLETKEINPILQVRLPPLAPTSK